MKNLLVLVFLLAIPQLCFGVTANLESVANVGGGGNTTLSSGITFPVNGFTGTAATATQGLFTVSSGSGLGTTPTQHAGYPYYKDGTLFIIVNGSTFHCLEYCYMSSSTANIQIQTLTTTASITPGTAHGSLTGPVFEGGADEAYTTVTDAANIWRCDSHVRTWGSGAGAITNVYPATQVGAAQTYATKCTGYITTP